jgi:ABC-type amino acid transport substrate-binding protein
VSVARLVLAALLVLALASPAASRPLAAIRDRGSLSLCAHANALPFSSRKGNPPGFQIEIGEALAARLGVALGVEWVISGYQFRAADCDIVLDTIAVPEAQAERRLRLSKPYQQSGVALALRPGLETVRGFADLAREHRVAVQVGSLAAMMLGQRGVRIVPFGFEDEMVDALARGEVDAAAVSPATIGYFNLTHAVGAVRLVHAYEAEPELAWSLVVGMRRADDALGDAVNAAIDHLLADGTIARIYARYGIQHRPPPRR